MLASACICRARPPLASHSPLFSCRSSTSHHRLQLTSRHSSSLSLITMHTSQHPYRIHTTTAAPQSPVTLPSSPHTALSTRHAPSTLPSSSSAIHYHPHPSHLTTHVSPDPSALSFSVMQVSSTDTGSTTARLSSTALTFQPSALHRAERLTSAHPVLLCTVSCCIVLSCQYNILAGPLATSEHFPFAKPHLLDWSYRRQAIVSKIKEMMSPSSTTAASSASPASHTSSAGAMPTFLCFQELTDFWTYFEPQLSSLGYKAIYIKRPSLHMSNWSGTEKHDGCLVAYQQSMVRRVVDVDQINYDDAHDRVGLVVLFEWATRVEGVCPYVMIGTTHLYWDHKLLAVQVNELDQLLTSVTRMQRKHEVEATEGGGGVGPIPTVIAGDFNNGPSSQIYSRVVDHHTFHPIASLSNGSRGAAHGSPSHAADDKHFLYRYESSYAAGGKEPPCTTATHRRCWTIDYIFYSHSATPLPTSTAAAHRQPTPIPLLRVTHTNPLPSESDLRSEAGPAGWKEDERLKRAGQIQEGIPNSKQPSDHVPLFARFEVRRQTEREAGEAGGEQAEEPAGQGAHAPAGRRSLLDKS